MDEQQIRNHFREVFSASSFHEIVETHQMVEFAAGSSCVKPICEAANVRDFRFYLSGPSKESEEAVFTMKLKYPQISIELAPPEPSVPDNVLHFAHFNVSRDPQNLPQIWRTLIRGGVLSIGGVSSEEIKRATNEFLINSFDNPPKYKTTSSEWTLMVKGR